MTSPAAPFAPTTPVTVGTLHGWVLTVDGTDIRVEFDDGDLRTYPVSRVRVGHLVDVEDDAGLAGELTGFRADATSWTELRRGSAS